MGWIDFQPFFVWIEPKGLTMKIEQANQAKRTLQEIVDWMYARRDEMRKYTYSPENEARYTEMIQRTNDAIALLDDVKQWIKMD